MGRNRPTNVEELDDELLKHIQALGLTSVEEYRQWCSAQGLSRKLLKDYRRRSRERSIVQQRVIAERLLRKKQELRNPVELFSEICAGRRQETEVTQPHLRLLCQAIRAQRAPGDPPLARAQLSELLLHLHAHQAKLFDNGCAISDWGCRVGNSFIEALVLVAAHHRAWLRPLADWRPRTHNARRQFASLLRHLLVRYDDMPLAFDSVWFAGAQKEAASQRKWYLHVGEGENIRFCNLPIPLSKRMAHHFMHAPSDLTCEKALRWGQVLGMGGDERLARAVVATRLGESFEHDEFWRTFIQWLMLHPLLDPAQIGPMIDYLHEQRFVAVMDYSLPGARRELPPPQPNLTMKGRSPESLLTKVEQWHRRLAKDNAYQIGEWSPAGIQPFEFLEGVHENGTQKFWTIRELLSSKALATEGRQLKHCVATYARSCARGQCSIWTMELVSREGKAKVLTVEVRNQHRVICQARGKLNRMPTDKERQILRRWATQASLTLASHL